jgi:hypothetical protein
MQSAGIVLCKLRYYYELGGSAPCAEWSGKCSLQCNAIKRCASMCCIGQAGPRCSTTALTKSMLLAAEDKHITLQHVFCLLLLTGWLSTS